MEGIRMVVVEDDERLSKAIRLGLSRKEGLILMGVYGSAEAALEAVRWEEVDVLISDLGLPGMGGVELIGEIKRRVPRVVSLAYTLFDDQEIVFAALKAGASGYLLKGCSLLDLEASVRRIHAGECPMSPAIARRLLGYFLASEAVPASEVEPLSIRESTIVKLLAEGMIYKEVGERLGISPHTVHGHIKNIYGKLQVGTRAEAVMRARDLGYLD